MIQPRRSTSETTASKAMKSIIWKHIHSTWCHCKYSTRRDLDRLQLFSSWPMKAVCICFAIFIKPMFAAKMKWIPTRNVNCNHNKNHRNLFITNIMRRHAHLSSYVFVLVCCCSLSLFFSVSLFLHGIYALHAQLLRAKLLSILWFLWNEFSFFSFSCDYVQLNRKIRCFVLSTMFN